METPFYVDPQDARGYQFVAETGITDLATAIREADSILAEQAGVEAVYVWKTAPGDPYVPLTHIDYVYVARRSGADLMPSFRVAIYVPGEAEPSYNALRFATREEAEAYGHDLLSRWFLPTHFEVEEVTK